MKYIPFIATIKKNNGRIINKEVEATSEDSARIEAGIYGRVLRVMPSKKSWFRRWREKRLERRGFKDRDRIEMLQTLSNMLVGYKLSDALSVMVQNFSGPIKVASQRVRQLAVLDSKEPVDAFDLLGRKFFPGTTIAIMRSNAKIGHLVDAIKESLEFEREMAAINKGRFLELAMAVVFFFLSGLSIIVTQLYGLDALNSVDYFVMMPESGKSRDLLVDTFSWLSGSYYIAVFALGSWAIFGSIILGGRDIKSQAPKIESIVLRIPLLRGAMLNQLNFVTTYQIYKLISKGVPMLEAFKYVEAETREGVLKEDLKRVIECLSNGDVDWVDAFYSFTDLDRALLKSATKEEETADVFKAQSDQFLYAYDKSLGGVVTIHKLFTNFFMIVLVLVFTMIMFLPMMGGFELVDQL
jgi:type II secretory pathway component PulF